MSRRLFNSPSLDEAPVQHPSSTNQATSVPSTSNDTIQVNKTTSVFGSIHSSRFFAPITEKQIQDDLDEEEAEKRNKELELQQTKSVVSSIQQAKAKRKNKDDRSSSESKTYKLVGDKRIDELKVACESILNTIQNLSNINKINDYFSNLQKCASRYEKFYGENSIKNCQEFIEFCIAFQSSFHEFENFKGKRPKDVIKKINILHSKLNKSFFIPFEDEIKKFKEDPSSFSNKNNNECSDTSNNKSLPEKLSNKINDPSIINSMKPIIAETTLIDSKNNKPEKNALMDPSLMIDKETNETQTNVNNIPINTEDNQKQVLKEDTIDEIPSSDDDQDNDDYGDDQTQMSRVGLNVALLDMDMDEILMNDALINFQTFFLKKNILALTERMDAKKLKKSKPKKIAQHHQNIAKSNLTDSKADSQPLTLEEKYFKTPENLTNESFFEMIKEFSLSNISNNLGTRTILDSLFDLLTISKTNHILRPIEVYLKLQITSTLLSTRVLSSLESIKEDDLLTIINMLIDILDFLISPENQLISISNNFEEDKMNLIDSSKPLVISGSLLQIICDTDMEFWNLLRASTQSPQKQYIQVLSFSKDLITIFDKCILYCKRVNIYANYEVCTVYIRFMQHLYYLPSSFDKYFPISKSMADFNDFILKNSDNQIEKTRSLLYFIIYLSNHENYLNAKKLLLISSISNSIDQKDINTQILYNHAIINLGIAAFVKGDFETSHQFLSQLHNMNKFKELLGQNLNSVRDRTELRRLIDSKVQVPIHLEISPNVVEFCYLISDLFHEAYNLIQSMPNDVLINAGSFENVLLSSHLKHILLKIEREYIVLGEPDKIMEHVYCLFIALFNFDMKKCLQIIRSKNIYDKVFVKLDCSEYIIAKIDEKCKEICLVCYIVRHQSVFETLDLNILENVFDISKQHIIRIISKCICQNIINGHLDLNNNCFVYDYPKKDLLMVNNDEYINKISHLYQNVSNYLTNFDENKISEVNTRLIE